MSTPTLHWSIPAGSRISKSSSILIVDDSYPMRKTIMDNLTAIGFENIQLATSGLEAMQILEKQPVDILFTDWHMPDITGMDILKYVRNEPRFTNTYFMLLIVEEEHKNILSAISEGVDGFLVKPFSKLDVRNKLSHMLSQPPRQKEQQSPGSDDIPASVKLEDGESKPEPKSTILVVDDVPANIDVIRGILQWAYKLKAATSGDKALKIAFSDPKPDLILLDVMMPEMDGYEVCQRLKADIETKNIPIIFLTAKSKTADMIKGFELGAVDYITKPADPDLLKARVKTHLKIKHTRDELNDQLDIMIENARLKENSGKFDEKIMKKPLFTILNTTESLLESGTLSSDQQQDLELIHEHTLEAIEALKRQEHQS